MSESKYRACNRSSRIMSLVSNNSQEELQPNTIVTDPHSSNNINYLILSSDNSLTNIGVAENTSSKEYQQRNACLVKAPLSLDDLHTNAILTDPNLPSDDTHTNDGVSERTLSSKHIQDYARVVNRTSSLDQMQTNAAISDPTSPSGDTQTTVGVAEKTLSSENPLPSTSFRKTSFTMDDNHNASGKENDPFYNSDDSCLDEDYIPSSLEAHDSDSSTNIISNSQSDNIIIPETPQVSTDEEIEHNVTNVFGGRKRIRHNTSLKERKILKRLEKNQYKYAVKPGCDIEVCKKKCHFQITQDTRKSINFLYRNMAWNEQQLFIINNTSQEQPKRITIKDNRKLGRNVTVSYFFSNEAGTKVNVCRSFFLETLGYKRKNDKSVRTALGSQINEIPVDKRGTNPNPKKIDDSKVIEHIQSFNPSISHYRREHAPNRKYLPSDLSVTLMYKDFCEKQNAMEIPMEEQISYDYYRKVVKKLNISFTKLGHEECEVCEIYFIHNPEHKYIRHRNCKQCQDFEQHRIKFVSARQAYKEDVEKQNTNNHDPYVGYFAADLEKVIMLPRIEQYKIVMFCPRIILFNESFVPIGDKKHPSCSLKTFASIWHEAISGRKMNDITSCFRSFLLANRDLKHIVIWLDNCAGQNKNWTLYSYLVYLVNSVEVSYQTISLKYLEVGHTHMAADEFHHQVELSIKRKKHLYDFEDFHQAVLDTKRDITVKVMNVDDFHQFEDCSSTYKLQNSKPRAYLANMCEVIFKRGTHFIEYKTAFDGEKFSLDFLRLKNIKCGVPPPKPNKKHRGITQERKSAIISKLTPLMPDSRKSFWYDIPVDKNSVDLTKNYED